MRFNKASEPIRQTHAVAFWACVPFAVAAAAVVDHSKDSSDAPTGPIIGIDLGTTYSW